jgi:trimeric autotransporter adhesin
MGVGTGTATVSYTTTCGTVFVIVTVNGLPGPISGNAPVCVGSTISLANSLPGGVWSIAPSSVATISTGGIVTGIAIGTATVSYTTTCGSVFVIVTVNGLPGPISGNTPVCVGSIISLTNSLPGGVWSIATSTVATISSGGIVTGVGAGTATVSYTTTCGTVFVIVTVNGLPGPISGNAPVCLGSTISLTNSLPGGVWSIAPSSVATISSGGIVTGVGAGTATVSYTTTCGAVFVIVTVNGLPGPISGNSPVCVGSTISLTNSLPGGVWSIAPSSVATISTGGIVTGIAIGTATVSYTTTCGSAFVIVTVNGLPGPISGNAPVCVGSTISLSNSSTGGVWSIAPSTVAAISSGGIVTGVGAGTATVSYTTTCGSVFVIVTVNGLPGPISGNAPVCVGSTISLTNSLPGGVWSIAPSSVATISTGGIVTGIAIGTATVSYTTTCGSVFVIVTVNGLPGPISGNAPVCVGSTISLTNSLPGGVWSIAPSSVANISSGGIVTGIGAGTATASYTTSCGLVSVIVTVNGVPGPITGNIPLCPGSTITLGNSLAGGTWTCAPVSVATISPTGDVSAIALGTALVSYVTTCGTVTATVTVDGAPGPITGNIPVCMGSTITLANSLGGGAWSCAPSSVATISSTGITTPVSVGTATVSYVTTCGTVTAIVTVNGLPGPITGNIPLCIGATNILSNSLPGGTWSCAPSTVATISTSGVVTALGAGTATVSYTTYCGIVTVIVTVNGFPSPINGPATLCAGTTITLSNSMPGGTWTCTPATVATISSGGIVTGVGAGTAVVSYTTTCGSVSLVVTVTGLPGPITGNMPVCPGGIITLSNSFPGGTWSCAPSSVATITSSGNVTAIAPGTASVSYTTTCGSVTVIITVNSLPGAITGNIPLCPGNVISLSNPLAGGTWSCAPAAIATISAVGVVTAITSGTATVSYVTTCGSALAIITVNPLPGPIAGNTPVCMGSTITLSNILPGGTWSCLPASVATISTTGAITTISAGTATVSYTTTCGTATTIVTVVPLPGPIAGNIPLCPGNTVTLTNPVPGGAWICAPTTIATITTTGDVTAVATGTAVVSYLTTCGSVAAIVTVDPLPGPISGNTPVCTGNTIALSNSLAGGTWSCSPATIATINTSGVVTTLVAGTATVIYTTTCGSATTVITANPNPAPIAGNIPLCPGNTITLTNTTSGGVWSCTPSGVATITAAGLVTGINPGTAIVSYTLGLCSTAVIVTVNPSPVIGGISFINPVCGGPAGSITINGLIPGQTYTVHYTYSSLVTLPATASTSGSITITGLNAGSYSAISVNNSFGCTSNIVGPITLTLTNVPVAPVVIANSPCQGDTLSLSASSVTAGVTFHWSGPMGFTATTANTYIYPAYESNSGSYTVTATLGMCTSPPTIVNVIIHPQPVVTNISFGNPKSCYGDDGWIELSGLVAGEVYSVDYLFNGTPSNNTLTADGSGKVRLSGLVSGTYTNFVLTSSFGCSSASIGPVVLYFPGTPPPPVIEHNDPCVGQTLFLSAYDAMPGGTYAWAYPDGGGSTLQNHLRHNVTTAAAGIYTVTYTVEGCPNSATANILVYTPIVLTDVTPDQTIPFGTSIQLNSQGAILYRWTPSDGSLNNPNINNPIASPNETTTYTVYGTGDGGCIDSARVTITIGDDIDEFIPTAFTPNGDGLNDIFRIRNMRTQKLVEFSVYNRYGERVYYNGYSREQGWDGTYKGVPCDGGTYFYYVIVGLRDGTNRIHKGDVTLIR